MGTREKGVDHMRQKIGLVALVVPSYEAGLAFFVDGLGFELVDDVPQGDKRWVVVRPVGAETGLGLARAGGPEQVAIRRGAVWGSFCIRMILSGIRAGSPGPVVCFRKIRGTKPMELSRFLPTLLAIAGI